MTAAADLARRSSDEAPDPERPTRYRLGAMRLDDVAEVGQVERRCFTNPWPLSAYRRELQHPDQNHYVVLRQAPPEAVEEPADGDGNGRRQLPRRTLLPLGFVRRDAATRPKPTPIVGFAGMWTAFDEAHVTTIAVDEPFRGLGLGEALLAVLFDEADRRVATWLTLEVRVSNEPAQELYRKWGFAVQGTRRRYYSDNNEDAHIMWSKALTDPDNRLELAAVRTALADRLGDVVDGFSPEMAMRPTGPPPRPPWGPAGEV